MENKEIWREMCFVVDLIRKIQGRINKKVGIPTGQLNVLQAIKLIDQPVIPARLSEYLNRRASSVTGILNRMEKQGLIERAKDLRLKNLTRVVITEKGEEFLRETKDDFIKEVFASLSDSEKKELSKFLTELANTAREVGWNKHRVEIRS